MKTLICPRTDMCSIYGNWTQQTKDTRLNIIIEYIDNKYHCIALDALFDAETGIPKNKELEERLKNEETGCSHIETLNNSKVNQYL